MKRKFLNRYFILILVLMLTLLGSITFVVAKYVSEKYFGQQQIESYDFYFTSNYAKTEGATYTTSDWVNGIKIRVYNYDLDNQNKVSESDILYKIEVPNDWKISVYDYKYNLLSSNDSYYNLTKRENNYHDIVITYEGDKTLPEQFEIKISSNSPYNKVLKATFIPKDQNMPTYIIKDMGNYISVIIETNAYNGNVQIKWDADKFSPDNTNPLMDDWLDDDANGKLIVNEYSTYTLIFVENVSGEYGTINGSSTVIELK